MFEVEVEVLGVLFPGLTEDESPLFDGTTFAWEAVVRLPDLVFVRKEPDGMQQAGLFPPVDSADAHAQTLGGLACGEGLFLVHMASLREMSSYVKQVRMLPSGKRRFFQQEINALLRKRRKGAPRCVIYARVSSAKQAEAGNLDRQRERLSQAARERGYEIAAVIAEQASGLNEKRRGLKRLFRMAEAGQMEVVLVEFRDRLARFGFAYIEEALTAYGVRVEVVDGPVAVDAAQELVQDMLAIVSVFAARLYGTRSQKFRRRVKAAMKEVEVLEGSQGLPRDPSQGPAGSQQREA